MNVLVFIIFIVSIFFVILLIIGDKKKITGTEKKDMLFADGTPVYYNPIEGKKCTDYTETNSKTGIKTGCMKFYVFNNIETSEKIKTKTKKLYILKHILNNKKEL